MPSDLRCDGNVSGRNGADLLYLLGFLQSQFLIDGFLLLLLILSKTEKHRMTDEYTFASHVKAPWMASTNQNSDVPGALQPYTVDVIFTWGCKSHNGLKASLPWVINQGKHQSNQKNPYRQLIQLSVHNDRITHSAYTTCENDVVRVQVRMAGTVWQCQKLSIAIVCTYAQM